MNLSTTSRNPVGSRGLGLSRPISRDMFSWTTRERYQDNVLIYLQDIDESTFLIYAQRACDDQNE